MNERDPEALDERLARGNVRRFACPECGAGPGERCVGARGKAREGNHLERVALALREEPGRR